jgi:hypothetical protein
MSRRIYKDNFRINLKEIGTVCGCGLGPCGLGEGSVFDFSEDGSEPSCSINDAEFLGQLMVISFSRRRMLPGVVLSLYSDKR